MGGPSSRNTAQPDYQDTGYQYMDHNGDVGFDGQAAAQWLRLLHDRHDGTGYFTISWTTPRGPLASRHFPVEHGVEQAVEHLARLSEATPAGIYARITAITEQPERRGNADISYTLPALWADLDIEGPGHKHAGPVPLPADEDQARAVITESGLPEPSVWIHSGGGLYPIWLIEPVPVIAGHLEQAKALSRSWQDIIGKAATRIGLHYGTEVSDLARVLRVPGTVNRKAGLQRPCQFLSVDGPTYTSRQLRDAAAALAATQAPPPPPPPPPPPRPSSTDWSQWADDGVKPGDDFNAKATPESVADMLYAAGWTFDHDDSRKIYIRRPGKTDPGHSATIDRTTCGLWVFSGDAHPFRAHIEGVDRGERPFSVYAILHHGGKYEDAARALARQGYGRRSSRNTPPPRAQQEDQHGDDIDQEDEQAGGELPAPTNPMAVSRVLVTRMTTRRVWWRGDFYVHRGTHYDQVENSTIHNWIYRQTEHATYVHVTRDGPEDRSWAPTKRKVADVADALGVGVLHRSAEQEADKVLAVANGVVDITGGRRQLLPHAPDRFNLFSLPFAYDPHAECPKWLAFLESVLPGDRQSHEFLGEWFGYVLSGRTDQQKMAALIGEKRSGKGTIARILAAMLGKPNVAGLDINHIPTQFGLENLIGKALAVAGDVRWHSRQIGDAVPLLLRWSGEDVMDVHRKNRSTWNGQLGARIMMMSNDTPTFSDRSGALAGRMVFVKFNESFYGREDPELGGKLMDELPGILNWALDGLDRLVGRGAFVQPETGLAEVAAVERLSNPVGAFVDDWATYDIGRSCWIDDLLEKYQRWCESEGRTKDSTTKEIFSKNLRAKAKADGRPVTFDRKRRPSGGFSQMVTGIYCDVAPTANFRDPYSAF